MKGEKNFKRSSSRRESNESRIKSSHKGSGVIEEVKSGRERNEKSSRGRQKSRGVKKSRSKIGERSEKKVKRKERRLGQKVEWWLQKRRPRDGTMKGKKTPEES
jgi:hypothetical protein